MEKKCICGHDLECHYNQHLCTQADYDTGEAPDPCQHCVCKHFHADSEKGEAKQ